MSTFYKVEISTEGARWLKKCQKLVNVVCKRLIFIGSIIKLFNFSHFQEIVVKPNAIAAYSFCLDYNVLKLFVTRLDHSKMQLCYVHSQARMAILVG